MQICRRAYPFPCTPAAWNSLILQDKEQAFFSGTLIALQNIISDPTGKI